MLFVYKGHALFFQYIIIIKIYISNFPTYFISLFSLPPSVAKQIEKLQHDFLWGGMGEEIKVYLVSWYKVCSLIIKGGL
jgi:hypothetical protein